MKKTGEFLRKAREEKGLSVHEIGLSLKINPKILKQIEDGDKNNLPAKTFLRGFVQSYALFLKIDPNEVLRLFSDEMGTTKPHQISLTSGPQIKGSNFDIEDPENKDDLGIKRHTGQNFNKEKFEFRNVGIGIIVFVLLLSLIAVRKVVEKYQREAEVDLAKAEENLKSNKLDLPQAPVPSTPLPALPDQKPTAQAPTTGPTVNPPMAQPAAQNTIASIPKIDPPSPPAAPNVKAAAGETSKPPNKAPVPTAVAAAPSPTVTPTKVATTNSNPPAPKPMPTAAVDEIKKPATAPPVSATAPKPKPATTELKPAVIATTPALKEESKKPKNIELVIEAFESVEIEMTQSTGKIEKIKLAPSQIQTIKTVSGVKLNISNGGAVNLSVNGKDIGVPGDLGKPKRVSF